MLRRYAISIHFVDSEPHVLELLSHICEQLVIEHAVSTSAYDALSTVDSNTTIVITDLELPGIDGVSFADILRSQHPEIAVFCFTNGSSTHSWGELNEIFDMVFMKPDDYSRMIAEAMQALAKKKYPFLK